MGDEKNFIEESGLKFEFTDDVKVIKFDDGVFYRKMFNKLPGAKGVDILADSKELVQFIEIKNCTGHEVENMWRTSTDNSRIASAPGNLDVENRESLDIEVARKVTTTIACLYGAWTKSELSNNAAQLLEFWNGVNDLKIIKSKKKIIVFLVLEGDFCSSGLSSRSKKAMMQRLQESINTKLAWLNCKVSVVDSNTYNDKYFKIRCL